MSRNPSTDDIRATLLKLARPEMSPKDLLREMRKAHPEASKKEIIHAAFASIIEVADADPEKALSLQDFALTERGSGES
jgi:hypothetical protein